jgi:hypothetical protein
MNNAIQARATRDLCDRIIQVRDACQQFLKLRIKEERDQYPGLPDAVIERALTKGDRCSCAVVLRLIEEQKQNDAGTREALRLDERDGAPTGRQARPQAKA